MWLFGKAGEILGYLRNPTLAEQIRHSNGDPAALNGEGLTVVSITDLVLASGFGSVLGLLVGLIISLVICRIKKQHWINPLLAFLLVYLIGWFDIDGSSYLTQLLRIPGEALNGIWYYLINGLVSIVLGLMTFILIILMIRPNNNQHLIYKSQSA